MNSYNNYDIMVTTNAFSNNDFLKQTILKDFPNTKFNITGKRLSLQELINCLKESDGAIVGLDEINNAVLSKTSKLKVIAKYGVGLNNIDIKSCKDNNVHIGWSGGVNRLSVAEMALGFMLMLNRNLYITSNRLKDGVWNKSGGFQLSGKTIGIIGVGYIGKEVVRLLSAFNCKILVNDIINQDEYYQKNNLTNVTKKEIYESSDIISIHTPLDKNTKNMISIKEFKLMKKSAYILNNARGGIVNEEDLKYSLQNGIIAGAGIDAYINEPPSDLELLSLENLICTPHIGGNTKEAVEAMGKSAIKHLKEFFIKKDGE